MPILLKNHIRLEENQIAWIGDTNIKVLEIALEHLAHGSSAVEICDQHNGYLTLGQIHAALAHYYDHQQEYDKEIDRQLQSYDDLHAGAQDSPGRRRLRAAGRLR